MSEVISLPDNFISKGDQRRLESFAGHTIARGRATRWQWGVNDNGDDTFSLYTGGEQESLAAWVDRDHAADKFRAYKSQGQAIAKGPLEKVMAALDEYFMRLHNE
jgi:hypothetical protein